MPIHKKKIDKLAALTASDYAHHSSAEIYSRIRVLQVELDEVTSSINALTSEAASLKERRSKIEAHVQGLTAVVEKR